MFYSFSITFIHVTFKNLFFFMLFLTRVILLFLNQPLLSCRNAFNFYMLILYPTNFLNCPISSINGLQIDPPVIVFNDSYKRPCISILRKVQQGQQKLSKSCTLHFLCLPEVLQLFLENHKHIITMSFLRILYFFNFKDNTRTIFLILGYI